MCLFEKAICIITYIKFYDKFFSLEEKKLGQFLANIRQGLIKPYNKLETEAEKEEYRKEHPELDDVMEIIEWIDENNVKVKEVVDKWLADKDTPIDEKAIRKSYIRLVYHNRLSI